MLFYDNNLTDESRLIRMLKKKPNWLIEHKFDEFDADDIQEYLASQTVTNGSSSSNEINSVSQSKFL